LKKIAILGDGHMATETMRIVARFPELRLTSIAFHDNQDYWTSRLRREAQVQRCEALPSRNIAQGETVDHLRAAAPDLILSVNNSDIIKSDLLALPADGIINFHNGPLPQYRGVNIPSWAIINGETTHSISWHFVDDGVDTGPVALTAPLCIEEDETAISLIVKCIEKGLETLPALLKLYTRNDIHPEPQKGPAHYYAFKDSPNSGKIDLSWSCSRITSLVRGLTFRPYPNTFECPKIAIGNRWYCVGHAEQVEQRSDNLKEGGRSIVDVEDNGLIVSANFGQSPNFDSATRSILPLRFSGRSGSTHTRLGTM
jgi:methionyl-tRNA formyltransferase